MGTKFNSKADAQQAVDRLSIPCAGPVYVSPVESLVTGMAVGWYVGSSVKRALINLADYEVAA